MSGSSSTSRAPLAHLISRLSDVSMMSFNESDSEFDAGEEAMFTRSDVHNIIVNEAWYQTPLIVVVIGASGDLAKKKTYPALFELFENDLLPRRTWIWGYARSEKTHEGLRKHLQPYLLAQCKSCSKTVEEFLQMCFYHSGSSYGDEDAYQELTQLVTKQQEQERKKHQEQSSSSSLSSSIPNLLYYLAIPPNVFGETVNTLYKVPNAVNMETTKFIIEKPFGRDLSSCKELLKQFTHFPEHMMYRIDHYLGKPIVDNIVTFRMANPFIENMWNHQFISSVHITFKEPFGTLGRGGYFDHYGIIRDVIQNHLLQILLLLAMELPSSLEEQDEDNDNNNNNNTDKIRQAKVQVLQNMPPVTLQDTLLGQYDGYKDDDTIQNKDTVCPTYVACRCWVHTERWKNVPFIMEAGKALDDRLVDVKVQFKNTAHPKYPSNTLILRVQPDPCIAMMTNMKPLGLIQNPNAPSFMTAPMMMNYPPPPQNNTRRPNNINQKNNIHNNNNNNNNNNNTNDASSGGPMIENAYTRLLMDALRGKHDNFCRDDELIHSWELFTPLLHQIERDHIQPESYKEGSTGPERRDQYLQTMGIKMETNNNHHHMTSSL